jgi:uncharacterized membrane protein YeaQ/YmgE (transglycosylase-associated protein family)
MDLWLVCLILGLVVGYIFGNISGSLTTRKGERGAVIGIVGTILAFLSF